MIETITLSSGVTLRVFRDTRFKQGAFSIQLARPMAESEAAENALLPAVLLRGTREHPTLRCLTERLDDLYGATLTPLVRRVGDIQTTGLYCGFMDDRFALPGDRVLEQAVELAREVLLNSPLEGSGFLPEFVEGEKVNLISTIEAELNDKRSYAMGRMLDAMCRGDSYGIPRLGRPEWVQALDGQGLRAHYETILRESPMEIFYVGSAPAEEAAEYFRRMLEGIPGNRTPMPTQTPLRPGPAGNLTERQDVAQGHLCMGFTTSITGRDPRYAAMQVLGNLYGGGMTSKLFQNLREKQSLCYSVGSTYSGCKGILSVYAGIDPATEDAARTEILRQLELCRAGEITPEELTAAREAVISSLRAVHDSPGAIESYYATTALSGADRTPEETARAVNAVTAEDAADAARSLQLHTTYFLKGECP